MNKEELIEFIDELHHNRDYYSRAKLLELIKEKINSSAQRENSNVSDNESEKIIRKCEYSDSHCTECPYITDETVFCNEIRIKN